MGLGPLVVFGLFSHESTSHFTNNLLWDGVEAAGESVTVLLVPSPARIDSTSTQGQRLCWDKIQVLMYHSLEALAPLKFQLMWISSYSLMKTTTTTIPFYLLRKEKASKQAVSGNLKLNDNKALNGPVRSWEDTTTWLPHILTARSPRAENQSRELQGWVWFSLFLTVNIEPWNPLDYITA